MEYVLICIAAFFGSSLTLFSGFGLGTILLPVFALFFPLELAVALTALVHFLNNIFKLVLLGKHADKNILIKFGVPSILSAFIGAWLLGILSQSLLKINFELGNYPFNTSPLKILMGTILLFFALFEIIPALQNLKIDARYLPLGGLLSGFFGGISGNQGAIRSAFLLKAGLQKESYIATGVVIACLIDIVRISVYSTSVQMPASHFNWSLLVAATLSAFAGAYLGSRLIKKITIKSLQLMVAAALILFSVLLVLGLV